MILKRFLRALLFIALFILNNLIFCSSNFILNDINHNCIWIKHESITDTINTNKIIDFLSENKINKVFLEIYSNGEILNKKKQRVFNSKNGYFDDMYISGNDTISNRGFNPIQSDTSYTTIFNPTNYFLNKLITIDNVKVYAWMNIYKLWDKNFYPKNKNHFYYQCPECLEYDINGKSDSSIKLDKIQSLEWEGIFLSPLHPEVNKYLKNIVLEVISQNNYDGLVLDYLRYQNFFYGYNKKGLEIFEKKFQINPQDLNRGIISKYFGYKQTEIDSIQNLWDDFRISKITDFIDNINSMIIEDSLDYEILVVANDSNHKESVNRWYQNWDFWLRNNLVNYVIVKNHDLDFNDFNYNIKNLSKLYSSNHYDKLIIDLNLRQDNNLTIANKILALRLQKFNNLSLYYYESFKENIDWYQPIFKTINFSLNYE